MIPQPCRAGPQPEHKHTIKNAKKYIDKLCILHTVFHAHAHDHTNKSHINKQTKMDPHAHNPSQMMTSG